jgi:hypothetical protein
METKTVNLRDLPENFVRQAKAYAALSGLSLKDFVIQAVESAMQKEIQPNKVAGAMFAKSTKKREKNNRGPKRR